MKNLIHAIDLLRFNYIYYSGLRKGILLSRRSGYSAQKRRRELAKQKKRAAKKERKLHRSEQDEESLVAEYLGLEVESEEEMDEESEDTEESEETSD
jgi:hypothetical protein